MSCCGKQLENIGQGIKDQKHVFNFDKLIFTMCDLLLQTIEHIAGTSFSWNQ